MNYEKQTANTVERSSGELGPDSPRYIVSAVRLAGNMSPNYGQPDKPELNIRTKTFKELPEEEQADIALKRREAAHENMTRFFEASGVSHRTLFY